MKISRPTSLVGLLWHLARLCLPKRVWLVAGLLAVLLVTYLAWPSANAERAVHVKTRIATFNIEFFPKDDVQIREAFELIGSLNVSAVGLQEITDPALFAQEARRRLGNRWDFVYQRVVAERDHPTLHIGVLYDTGVFELQRVGSREETRIDPRDRPTLQVDLLERSSGTTVTLLVVHFKAMPEGRERRRRQFAGLLSILRDVHAREHRVVVMGDFNATEQGDRSDLQELSRLSGMVWATEHLQCSAFWERKDDCPTSRLDHVLSWSAPTSVEARGGCEDGCNLRDRCPLYRYVVSDHCPVVIELHDRTQPRP